MGLIFLVFYCDFLVFAWPTFPSHLHWVLLAGMWQVLGTVFISYYRPFTFGVEEELREVLMKKSIYHPVKPAQQSHTWSVCTVKSQQTNSGSSNSNPKALSCCLSPNLLPVRVKVNEPLKMFWPHPCVAPSWSLVTPLPRESCSVSLRIPETLKGPWDNKASWFFSSSQQGLHM